MLKSSRFLGTRILSRMIEKLPPAAPSDDLDKLLSNHAPAIWNLLERCWNFDPLSRPTALKVAGYLTSISDAELFL